MRNVVAARGFRFGDVATGKSSTSSSARRRLGIAGAAPVVAVLMFPAQARAQASTNLLQNSAFDSGSVVPWVARSTSAGIVDAVVSDDAYQTLDLDIFDSGGTLTDIEVGQIGVRIQTGKSYHVSFYAEDVSSPQRSGRIKIGGITAPYPTYFQSDFLIPNESNGVYGATFDYYFTATANDANAWFGLFLGGGNSSVKIDSLYLLEVTPTDAGTTGPGGAGDSSVSGAGGMAADAGAGANGTADAIFSNLVGYVTSGSKRATARSTSAASLPFRLLDASMAEVMHGDTVVRGIDTASGDRVHVVDFSAYATSGTNYRLAIGGTLSQPFDIQPDLYAPIRRDALRFFYHQRASSAIVAPYAEGPTWERLAGHPDSNVSCFPGSGCTYALDVSKGWYDAGDHGKYVVNGGIALYTLFNLYERTAHLGTTIAALGDGTLNIPESGNGAPDLLDEARYEMQFMLEMEVPDGQPLAGMVHHKVHDDVWTTPPIAPASDNSARHLRPPSTAATLNLAATAAQCARVFATVDPAFAAQCRAAAIKAYAAAQANPAFYQRAAANPPAPIDDGGGTYDDTDVTDEFYWAAAELYLTTGDKAYEDALRASPHFAKLEGGPFFWQSVSGLGTVSLAVAGDNAAADIVTAARTGVVAAANVYLGQIAASGYGSPIASYGWGSNGTVLNMGIVLALARDFTGDARYFDGAVATMDHVLGRNPLGQSYVSGFGERSPVNPHHRFWAHGFNPSWPMPPPGVLVGGPNSGLDGLTVSDPLKGCMGPKCWRDDAQAFSLNEVAINWNAPLAWLASWLTEMGTQPPTVSVDGGTYMPPPATVDAGASGLGGGSVVGSPTLPDSGAVSSTEAGSADETNGAAPASKSGCGIVGGARGSDATLFFGALALLALRRRRRPS
jgi:endoglucanase